MTVCRTCVSVCPHQPYLRNQWSDNYQIWHNDCLSHENASHVNWNEIILTLTFVQGHIILIMKIINVWLFQKLQALLPIKFAVKIDYRQIDNWFFTPSQPQRLYQGDTKVIKKQELFWRSLIKGLYDHCQADDRDLHSRSQVRLKFNDYFLTCS